jgi:hypothetical protein
MGSPGQSVETNLLKNMTTEEVTKTSVTFQ